MLASGSLYDGIGVCPATAIRNFRITESLGNLLRAQILFIYSLAMTVWWCCPNWILLRSHIICQVIFWIYRIWPMDRFVPTNYFSRWPTRKGYLTAIFFDHLCQKAGAAVESSILNRVITILHVPVPPFFSLWIWCILWLLPAGCVLWARRLLPDLVQAGNAAFFQIRFRPCWRSFKDS